MEERGTAGFGFFFLNTNREGGPQVRGRGEIKAGVEKKILRECYNKGRDDRRGKYY